MTTDTDYLTTPTDLPCPDWCGMPAGHGFDSVDPETGTLHRVHGTDVGRVRIGRHHRIVGIEQEESARSDNGPILARTEPCIGLWVVRGEQLDAGQARALAVLLMQAADQLDGLVRSTPAESVRCVTGQVITRPDDFTNQMWEVASRVLQLPIEQQVAVLERWDAQ